MRRTRPLLLSPVSVVLVATISVAVTSPARAQTPTPPRFEQQIVVTPTRSESTLDRVPAFVTLLDTNDIAESSAQDVADLLRQTGAHVTDVSGNRRSYRVDLRGFGATAGLNTLVLVDGRRVNQPDLSGTDWAQIPLAGVARIEVIRGSGGAVLFGDSATGGVINIITKSAEKNESVASVSGGAYSSLSSEVTSTGKRGEMSYVLSGHYDRSDGHRENADTKGGDVGGQFSFRARERFQIAVNGGYHGDKTGLPGAITASDVAAGFDRRASKTSSDFADIDDSYVMVTPRATLGARGYAMLDFSVRQRDSSFFSSFSGGEFTGATGTRTVAISPRIVLQAPFGATVNHVVAGLDASSAEEDITNTITFGGPPDMGRFTLEKASRGVYLQNELRAGRATITGGYRYDHADYSFTPSTPDRQDYDAHAGSVGATFATKQATVFGRVSRSFRYPVVDELFDFFGNTIQTTLVPQRSTDFEGGVRVESGRTQASLSAFRLDAEDEIFFNPIGGAFGFGANENLDGRSHRTGLELAASSRVGIAQVGGTLTFVKTDIDGGRYDGERMPGVPSRRGTIHAHLPIGDRLSIGLEGLFVGQRRFEGDFGGTFAEQDAYFLLNTKLAYQQGRARLFINLKNLFDEEYSEYGVLGGFPTQRAFYPSPGIHALAGVEVRF
jgi:iron complex outermembrane receptor protein